MRVKTIILPSLLGLALIPAMGAAQQMLTPEEALGKAIFFDENLSLNGDQSCATCHDPKAGWTGPDGNPDINGINAHGAVYEGSDPGKFGDRKPPSAAYATQSPVLRVDRKGLFVGGNFWDGRATGEILGSPAAEQAKGPFLNPVEQALPSAAELVDRVCNNDKYGSLFKEVWDETACAPANVETAYNYIGLSVAAYEASPEVNAFSSKFDLSRKGQAKLTPQEQKGWALFKGKGKCAKCHIANGQQPLFTDYTFDNLGVPKNPENPVYDYNPGFIDQGLGGFLVKTTDYADYAEANMGKHKVPTVRNVDKWDTSLGNKIKAYAHNGYFKSLEGIVRFYNTRDVKPTCESKGIFSATEAVALQNDCWPAPEVTENVNTTELGNLDLSADEEAAIVAFLKTLSDSTVVTVP